MIKTKAVIFDFDGVIADTMKFHQKHFKKYLGINLTKKEYQDWQRVNVFDTENFDAKKKEVSQKLVAYFKMIEKDHAEVKPFDGIVDLLKKLKENYKLFIVTSSSDVNIINFLKKEDIFDCFTEILGVEFDKSKIVKFNHILDKYNLKKDDVLFVTDTSGDVLEANKVCLRSVAVTWGFHDRKILEEAKPFAFVNDVKELLKIMKKN